MRYLSNVIALEEDTIFVLSKVWTHLEITQKDLILITSAVLSLMKNVSNSFAEAAMGLLVELSDSWSLF